VLGLGDVPRTLKHHVLEEVGQPALARLFVTAAGVICD
jgi:hypothetical protein